MFITYGIFLNLLAMFIFFICYLMQVIFRVSFIKVRLSAKVKQTAVCMIKNWFLFFHLAVANGRILVYSPKKSYGITKFSIFDNKIICFSHR